MNSDEHKKGNGGEREETPTVGGGFSSDREHRGLAALERLSLEELAALASKEIGESRQLQAEAVGLARRSAVTLFRAGRILWCARKMFKGKGKRAWTRWQREHQIPITSAWQAIRLYEAAESEEAIAGLTRKQALQKYGITKPKKDRPQQAPVMSGTAADQDAKTPEVGVTAPVGGAPPDSPVFRQVPERDGEAGGTAAEKDGTEAEQGEEAEESQATPATPPAAEVLLLVVQRLEILEHDVRGGDLGAEAHALIDRAIAKLRRLRGDSPATEAA